MRESSGDQVVDSWWSEVLGCYTWTLQGVSNGLPHNTTCFHLGPPWRVLVEILKNITEEFVDDSRFGLCNVTFQSFE